MRQIESLKQLESGVVKGIRQMLRLCNIFHFRHWSGPLSEDGIHDIIACMPVKVADLVASGIEEVGLFVSIEVKATEKQLPGRKKRLNKTEAAQIRFAQNVRDAKGITFFAASHEKVVHMLGLTRIRLGPLFARHREVKGDSDETTAAR